VGELSSRKVGIEKHKKREMKRVRQLLTENTKVDKGKIV
jgi:hypothetical protein